MALGVLTEALDNLYTTTWQNMKSTVVDQIFTSTPFWAMLKQKGGLESVEGGRFVTEPLSYAKSNRVKYFSKGATFELSDQEHLTVAVETWRYLGDSIVRFRTDDQQNRGKNAIINFMQAKLDMSKASLNDEMEIALYRASPAANQFVSLPIIVPATATASINDTVHGIPASSSNNSWWRPNCFSMTGVSFVAQGEAKMSNMLNTLMRSEGVRKEDYLIITDQDVYEYYEQAVGELRQLVNNNVGDAGFTTLTYKGVPFTWSPQATADVMYFVNMKYVKFKYDPSMWFDMTEWKSIPDSLDRAAQVVAAGTGLMTKARRTHGAIFGIDTP